MPSVQALQLTDFCKNLSLRDGTVISEVNLSDYCAISLSVYFPTVVLNAAVEHSPCQHTAVMWNKVQSAHIDSFKTCVARRITAAVHNVPAYLFVCRGCKDDKHRQAIEEFAGEFSNALN